ncbi:MAG: methyltransferase [Pseudomonadota bacterium]
MAVLISKTDALDGADHTKDGQAAETVQSARTHPEQLDRASWSDLFAQVRNSIIRRPGFIRWASRFWLTRPIARKRTSELFNLATGFVYTKILTTVVDLKLCERVADGPRSVSDLASSLDMPEQSLLTVLKGAEALALVRKTAGDKWGLDELGAALLANPGVIAMVEHHKVLYRDLEDPLALLRSPSSPSELSNYWAYVQSADPNDQSVSEYSALMASSQDFISQMVVDAYPFERHTRFVDLGGGEGRFAQAVVDETPGITAQIFDLPPVARRANERIRQIGASGRMAALGGNFFTDSLPGEVDLVTLVRVLHDHDDDKVLDLLANIRSAVRPATTVMIAEPLAETPGAEKAGAAYFGFYLMAMRSGRPRTKAELSAFLTKTGFSEPVEHSTSLPLLARVLSARAK